MLKDFIHSFTALVGLCDHSFRFAELVLLALFCFTAGCICGSVLTAQFLSPKLRTVLSRLIVVLLSEERWGTGVVQPGDRLQRYRA